MAQSFLNLYGMMTGTKAPEGEHDPWAFVHRWTLSRHLWEADSSFEFARRWREEPHFVIKNYAFQKFLEYGRADDVDDFSRILLTS